MKRIHLAWIVLAGCCLVQSGVLGIIYNCRGIFFDPICADLNVSLASLTRYGIYFGIACVIAIPFVPRVFEKKKAHLYLAFFALILGVSLYCSSLLNKIWQFYAIATIQGICTAFVYAITTATVLNNWFYEKKGLALGIAGACPALTGAILNPIVSKIIANNGWRYGYQFIGILFLVVMLPAFLFLVRVRPEDFNSKAYGEKQESKPMTGLSFNESFKRPDYYMLGIISGLATCITCYTQLLPKYGKSLGFIANPSILASASMIGNCISKFFIGNIADRKGPKAAGIVTIGIIVAGFSLLLIPSAITVYIGSFCIGVSTSVTIIVLPLLTRIFYGDKQFAKKMSYISMPGNLFNSLGLSVFGAAIDYKGYPASLILALILAISLISLIFISMSYNKKHRA